MPRGIILPAVSSRAPIPSVFDHDRNPKRDPYPAAGET
jgi:hypothetical protein